MYSFVMWDSDPGRAVSLRVTDDGTNSEVVALRSAGNQEASLNIKNKATIKANVEAALSSIRTELGVS